MKRLFTLFFVFVFLFVFTSLVSADMRTPEEKIASGRDYLKLLDTKIIKYRKINNDVAVIKLQKEKKSTIARMQKWKEETFVIALPPAPTVTQEVVINPPPRQQGILGLGINSKVKGSYIAGQGPLGAFGVQGQIIIDDPFGLGNYAGLLSSSVKYGVGVGAVYGKDINDNNIKAIPIYGDVIVNLPVSWTYGLDSYVTGGLNYVIYGTDRTSGNYGVQGAFGVSHDYGIGLGKTSVELGWSAVRCGSANLRSAKGITLSISQPIVL